MADSKRALVGFNNATPDAAGRVDPRGYVILGKHADWGSVPKTLTLDSKDYAVPGPLVTDPAETYDFVVRWSAPGLLTRGS